MLALLIPALVPLLVGQAEKIFGGGKGSEKRQWVMEAMKEAEPFIIKIAPDWVDKNIESLVSVIDLAIEQALDKLED